MPRFASMEFGIVLWNFKAIWQMYRDAKLPFLFAYNNVDATFLKMVHLLKKVYILTQYIFFCFSGRGQWWPLPFCIVKNAVKKKMEWPIKSLDKVGTLFY